MCITRMRSSRGRWLNELDVRVISEDAELLRRSVDSVGSTARCHAVQGRSRPTERGFEGAAWFLHTRTSALMNAPSATGAAAPPMVPEASHDHLLGCSASNSRHWPPDGDTVMRLFGEHDIGLPVIECRATASERVGGRPLAPPCARGCDRAGRSRLFRARGRSGSRAPGRRSGRPRVRRAAANMGQGPGAGLSPCGFGTRSRRSDSSSGRQTPGWSFACRTYL